MPAAARVNASTSGAAPASDLPTFVTTLPPSRAVPPAAVAATAVAVMASRVPATAARNGAPSNRKLGRAGLITLSTLLSAG